MSSDDEKVELSESDPGNIHSFLDRHINIVRYSSFVVAGIGVVVLGRSIRVASKFYTVKDIPSWMIAKHVRLQGTVKRVDQGGILHVDHIPIVALPKLKPDDSKLGVKIAGINVNNDGQLWLTTHLTGKNIWFRMLSVDSTDSLQSIVQLKKGWQRYANVNEHMIREGLGTVDLDFKMSTDHKENKDVDLLVKLLKLEERTKRKRMTLKDKTSEQVETSFNFIRNLKDRLFGK